MDMWGCVRLRFEIDNLGLLFGCEAHPGTKDENVSISNSTNYSRFVYGIAANGVAVFLCGSSFVPVKRIETGDGMFFQWVNSAAIWAVSMVGDLMLHSPKFYPLAMLGGVTSATGNIAVVTIIKAIGLGLGTLIWGSFSLLMGWASSRFGWFGIDAQEVSLPILNYCGAGLCLLSGLIFFFVKVNVELHPNAESIPLLIDGVNSSSNVPRSSEFWIDSIGPKTRRFIGCLLAVVVGLLYGSTFVPILYIENHSLCQDSMYYGASRYDLDYIYAHSCGSFFTSTVYFAIYCAAMKSKPRIYSRAILPGLLTGLMRALATYFWFLANDYLSSVITFPIVTAVSTTQHTVFLQGLSNCFIFFLATCVVLAGSIMTAFSKL
uniref:Transmembrane protein 144 n=1 Tax=Stegastes partitus TaxID=144197 RepID=A0A3B5A0U6_9TELE